MAIENAILRIKEFDGEIITLEINKDVAMIINSALYDYVNAHYLHSTYFKDCPQKIEDMEQLLLMLNFWYDRILSRFEGEEE
jgi:hypothetical protein